MPKAVIIGDLVTISPSEFAEEAPGEPFNSQLSLHIGWDKGLPGVQVGVRGVNPETGEENLTSQFITLTWSAVNRAIRELRTARDDAHGKPE